jgi:hypothetical protein
MTDESAHNTPEFIPGLRLNELFYAEVVAPILGDAFPDLHYSAALIGYGSEVLGYDTPRSTDHEWGPRMVVFLSEEDHATHREAIHVALAQRLPPIFSGHSTHFSPPGADGVQWPVPHASGPINHKIQIYPWRSLLTSWLGVDPGNELTAIDWLLMPQQKLLEVTAGRVFHDGLDVLEPIRVKFAYFPHDVWLYLIAAQWQRISQQEAFVGRTREVGDELGSAVIAAGLVRDLMRLCFLIERRYAPYAKWFGTAFAELTCASRLVPLFQDVLGARTWHEREAHLSDAYEVVAEMHNALDLMPPVDPTTRLYYGRPFQVLHAERFANAAVAAIVDPGVRAIIDRTGLIGSVDQISDNVDVNSSPPHYVKLRALYEPAQQEDVPST